MKDGVRSLVSSLVSDDHIQSCKIKKKKNNNKKTGKPRWKANHVDTGCSWYMRETEVGCKKSETEEHLNPDFWN